jgi:hypothetical protein
VPPKYGKAPVSVAQEDECFPVRAIAEFQGRFTYLHHPVLITCGTRNRGALGHHPADAGAGGRRVQC